MFVRYTKYTNMQTDSHALRRLYVSCVLSFMSSQCLATD